MTNKERLLQKKRLELFNNNPQGINKIILSELEKSFLYSKFVKSEMDPSLKELYIVYFENVESLLNEKLALTIFPYFADEFTYARKIIIEAEQFNKLKFKINEHGFTYEDYKTFGDFLKEPTGNFKSSATDKMTYNDLKLYSDVLKQILLNTLEAIFISSVQNHTKHYTEEQKRVFEQLSQKPEAVKKTEEFIKDFAYNYNGKIESMPFKHLFSLYNLEEEQAKLRLKKEDANLFKEQEEMIEQFVDSFKTGKEKKIIIRSRDLHEVFVTKDNDIVNELEDDVEDDFKFLINRIMYDFEHPSSLIVQERTAIMNAQGVEQCKVCGLIVNKGDFKVIEKDLIKQTYFKIIDNANVEDDQSYKFFNWLYNYLPDFN